MKILIAEPDNYSPGAISKLKKAGQVIQKKLTSKNRTQLLKNIDVLVIRLGIKADKNLLKLAPKLKIIATNTTGLNHVDLKEAESRHIKVVSLRGHVDFLDNIYSTAELTFGLILALIRNIPGAFYSVREGKWDRNSFVGHELNGKTLGILGLGRLGRIVAKYSSAFGMRIIACDPYVDKKTMDKFGVKKVSEKDLFTQSDILSVHVMHNSKTDKLIKHKHFKLMKPNSLFINTSRGEIVDEKALLKALSGNIIAGASIDVMTGESIDGKHLVKNPLFDYALRNNNLIIVPHIGGATIEAWQKTEEFLADLILKEING